MASRKSFRKNWFIPEKINVIEQMISKLKIKRQLVTSNNTSNMSESEFSDFIQELAHLDSFLWRLKSDLIILKKQQETSNYEN